MGHIIYALFRLLGAPWRFRLVGRERLPRRGAVVLVGNHARSAGPLQAVLTIPERLYPWAIADMLSYRSAPPYLYDDFIAPDLHLTGWFGHAASAVIATLAVTLLRVIGCVPVNKRSGLFDDSTRQSLALVLRGRRVLIFPEDRDPPPDPATGLRPFGMGFAWLAYRYEAATGEPLPVYPLAISPQRRAVWIGEALYLDRRLERRRRLRDLRDRTAAAIVQGLAELERDA